MLFDHSVEDVLLRFNTVMLAKKVTQGERERESVCVCVVKKDGYATLT